MGQPLQRLDIQNQDDARGEIRRTREILERSSNLFKARRDSGSSENVRVELSLVIPVYNGSHTIGALVEEIRMTLADIRFEIILVNDGSSDRSEEVCAALADQYPGQVFLVQLSRNFGEHNAVLAGLREAYGDYVAVLDDDGQNGAMDALRMFEYARDHNLDVTYARYQNRKHPWSRVLGSWFNDKVATVLLNKPPHLYLSSFKVMSRLVVDELSKRTDPFPYLDGLILRITRNIGQIDVEHRPRQAGRSGYTLLKLIGLWLNMCVGSSVIPMRLALAGGILAMVLGVLMLTGTAVTWMWINPTMALTAPCLLAGLFMFAGIQLTFLGVVGEYVGRGYLRQCGMPTYVLRYVRGEANESRHTGARPADISRQAPIRWG